MRAPTLQPSFRVFLSSPGDVKAEREAAERVVRRIGGIYAAHVDIVLERWEGKFYQATAGFQEQIEATSAFDLVVGILWKRIGTELPPDLFRRPDGTAFESGTVLELESALEASTARGGKPSIFVFRKNAEILFSKVNLADEKAQNDLLDAWWNRTFRDAEGRFRRASEGFMTTQEFETRFENLLVDQLREKRLIPDGAVWDIEDKGSPYPGLEPYGKERRSVLFGRSLAIRDACDELINASRLKGGLPALFVVGPSGSGKSSLVRSGIAPELTDPGVVADVDCWRSITVEGDAGLLGAIATQLYRDDGLPELTESPRKVSASWAQLSAEAPAAASEDVVWVLDRIASAEQLRTGADRTLQARLLLVVDQLEQMFGTDDAAKVSALLRALVATGRVWLIATLRSDRYAALQTDRDLLELRRHGTVYDLPPPGQAEISDIVKGPARAAGLAFQDGERDGKSLLRTLIENAPSADALPLLQMTLRELFDARDGMTLTWRAYEAMGGASGAIATHAGAVLSDLLPAVRSELPDLVGKLTRDVTREASGRIRFTATAADARWAVTPARQALVSRMVEERLLVEDEPEPGRKVLRVAHEALLRQWRPASNALEAIADRALRRARLLQFGAFASAVVFLIVAASAGWFYSKAKVAESDALSLLEEAARSDRLVAEEKLQGGQDADALAYLARASRYTPKSSLPAEAAIPAVLSTPIAHSQVTFQGHTAQVQSAIFSPDGRRVLTTSQDKTARLWEADSGKLLATFQGDTVSVLSAVFSPDGRRVLTREEYSNTARLWEADSGKPLATFQGHSGLVLSAVFSPDGRRVLTASDKTARLWEADSGKLLDTFQGHSAWVQNAVFSPDGRRVLTASQDHTARLWEADSGKLLATFQGHTDWVNGAVFSPDGRRVLTASQDQTARLWEADSGKLLATFQGDTASVQNAVFSPDGRRVLAASYDGTARLWPVLPADVTPPDWYRDFLQWLGGKRIALDGQIETISGDELLKLEARLRPHMNEDTDYARLLRWRLLPPQQRSVDPYGTTTQKQAADLIIRPDMNQYEAEHAYDLDPSHPLIHLALAAFEKDPVRADFLRQYSLYRLPPDDPKLRQRAAEFLRNQGKEDLAQEVEARAR